MCKWTHAVQTVLFKGPLYLLLCLECSSYRYSRDLLSYLLGVFVQSSILICRPQSIPIPTFLVVVVLSLSHLQLFATPWTAACQASLSFTISQCLLRFMSIESMLSNHLIHCCPLILLPSIFPSIRVFSNGLALRIRWPKYWSFSFSINPSSEYSGLIFFRIDWFDLLAIQGTLKSLLQDHSLKVSGPGHAAFFMV